MYGEEAMPRRTAQDKFKRLKDGSFTERHDLTGSTLQFSEKLLNKIIHEDPRKTIRKLAGIMKFLCHSIEPHLCPM